MFSLIIIASLTVLASAQTEYPVTSPTTATSSSTTGVIPAVNQENVRGPGLSYSGSESVLPASSSGHRSTTGQDEFGGHSLQHASHSAYSDPNTGETDVKQSRYYFHINPYVGQASVYTDNAVGAINPDQQAANFFHRKHNVRVTPGHGSYLNSADTASVTPQGNLAYQLFKASTGDFLPNGFFQNRRLAQLYHANHPLTGGFTSAGVLNRNVYYGPGQHNLNVPVVFPVHHETVHPVHPVHPVQIGQQEYHPGTDYQGAFGGDHPANFDNQQQGNFEQGQQQQQPNFDNQQPNFDNQQANFDNLQNNYGQDGQNGQNFPGNQNYPGQYDDSNQGRSTNFNLNYRYSSPSTTDSSIQQQQQQQQGQQGYPSNSQGFPGKKK